MACCGNPEGRSCQLGRYAEPAIFVLVIGAVGLIIWGMVALLSTSRPIPEYSMAVRGVVGLDPDDVAGDRHPTLSPVFNLTLRVSNPQDDAQACVPALSVASVFYRDVLLGKASVEPFCAKPKGEREGRTRAWGQDVAMPRFLRDQLAGELRRGDAAVDVTVKMPLGCSMMACFDRVFHCRAKIRGGSPCLMWYNEVIQSQH